MAVDYFFRAESTSNVVHLQFYGRDGGYVGIEYVEVVELPSDLVYSSEHVELTVVKVHAMAVPHVRAHLCAVVDPLVAIRVQIESPHVVEPFGCFPAEYID